MSESKELVQHLLRDFPDHQPGTRPVHAYGVVARARFRASDVAHRYTAAAPFAKRAVRVTVRFSSGTGDQGDSDARRDVRGMAVRFHGGKGAGFDMVCMTLPVFFVRTVDAFREFTTAAEPPIPPVTRSRWRDVLDQLNLRKPPKDPRPSDAGLRELSVRRPEVCPALSASSKEYPTESFATRSYHPVHAFQLTNDKGVSCHVRFHWEPVLGVRNIATTAEQFLQQELRTRDKDMGPLQFVLRAQIADQGDDLADPTRPWPQTRRRVVLGHLTLHRSRAVGEREALPLDTGEELEFDPHRLPDGIIVHPGDEIFKARGDVYRESARLRRIVRAERD